MDQVDYLVQKGEVIKIGDTYKISEELKHRLSSARTKSQRIDESTSSRFFQSLHEHGVELDPNEIWEKFNGEFLHPFVKDMGARMYELLTGSSLELDKVISFRDFLESFDDVHRENIRNAIVHFFDVSNRELRSYIFQILHAVLLIESTGFSSDRVSRLNSLMGKKATFKILVDTNFLFYLIDLDDSGFKEASDLLKRTIQDLSGIINIKLYVTPLTLTEAREKLASEMRNLRSIRSTANLAAATVRSGQVSGLREKYFSFQEASGKSISAQDYFTPYIDNIVVVLRQKGLEIYNDHKILQYAEMKKVQDDVREQIESQQRYNRRNVKSYEVLEHDCALWHFAVDKRPLTASTPVESEFFIVTTDFSFIKYD